MAKPVGSLKLSIDEVSQKIDLSKEAGVDLSRDPNLVNQIGQEIIDYMLERTANGRGIGGVKLKSPYSKAYADSPEFKAYGKTKNEVNMALTGDMLGSIDITNDSPDKLIIAIDGTDTDTKKAYNHNVGDTLPKRPFFGIDQSELDSIMANHEDDFAALKQDVSNTKDAIKRANLQENLIDIFKNINLTTEEL